MNILGLNLAQKKFQIILWRGFFVVIILTTVFNFIWLIPALENIRSRVFAHQAEILERVSVEFERLLADKIANTMDEVEVLPSTKNIITRGNFDPIQEDIFSFLRKRNDVIEYTVIDFSGNEIAKISNGQTVKKEELNNVYYQEYFKAVQEKNDVYMEALDYGNGAAPFIIASKRVSSDEGFYGVVKLTFDAQKHIGGFSDYLKEEDNEQVYMVRRDGTIMDHYVHSNIGLNVSDYDFVKKSFTTLSGRDIKEHEHYSWSYYNTEGVKSQAMADLMDPFDFLIIFEESYSDAWGAWQRILILSLVGLTFSTLLLIFLVKNTISMIYNADELSKKQKQTATIVANLTSGLIQFDKDFRIRLINPKAQELLGVDQKDILGKVVSSNLLKSKDKEKFESLVQVMYPSLAKEVKKITTKEGQPKMIEMTIQKPFEADLQVITIPLLNDEKNTIGFLKVLRDISREKAISKTKSEFISVAAHQLRTPLSAIKWVFKMLLDGDVGDITKEQKEFLQKGYDSNERIIQLVGDMLSVARIEEGRFGYEFYYVDLIEIIKKTIKIFEIKAEERQINIKLEVPKDAIQPLKMDPAKIELVLQNLIDNAIKYTAKDGDVTIRVKPIDRYVEISVSDTGVGVPKEQVSRLFSKFFRGSNVIKIQTEGTGLGLFITKNIIKRHGGEIWVETEEGKGTTFYFTLPKEAELIPEHEIVNTDAISL